jgi:6-pyruvoyltetrahydropterin/6-carboxytetrahydropterin synthase
MYTISVEKEYFHFCSAHFVIFSEKEREHIHGHNYYVSAKFSGDALSEGKLIDISEVKPIIKKICDTFDHKLILPAQNQYLDIMLEGTNYHVSHGGSYFSFPKEEVLVIPIDNTTMENFAKVIAEIILEKIENIENNVEEILITVRETQGQQSSYLLKRGKNGKS